MLLFLGENFFDDAACRRVGVTDVVDHLGLDGDTLGDEIFLNHGDEVVDLRVLGVGAGGEAIGVEVGGAAELDDALGELIGVAVLVLS